MQIAERLAWEDLVGSSSLASAHTSGRLPDALQSPRLADLAHDLVPRQISSTFLADLLAEMDPARHGPWQVLREPGARVVVTGQQPGCVGGPLLVLYKAATACALAERATTALGRPVVPVFWMGSDDDDYDEIARVAWPHPERGLLYLELPSQGRRVGGWVGDLPAETDRAVVDEVLGLVTPEAEQRLRPFLPDHARDHADWVASFLARVFPDLAILDGRSLVLRRHGAPLFARYLEQHERVHEVLNQAANGLRDTGYRSQLVAGEASVGLFLTGERSRRKVGSDLEPLERAVRNTPETLSPNVVLRVLLQDSLLPTVAHVVGPSELHYLVELRGLRSLLGVVEPVVVSRLTQTVIEKDLWSAARACDLPTLDLVSDPVGALRSHTQHQDRVGRAAVTGAFGRLEAELTQHHLPARVYEKTQRRLGGALAEFLGALETTTRNRLLEERPALTRLAPAIRPRDRAQERDVAALWGLALEGPHMGRTLVQHAKLHLDALEKQRLEHFVVVV